jgi:hypothetical protein
MRTTLILAGAVALAATLSAQQRGGGPGRQTGGGQPQVDVAKQFVIEGTVAAVHMAAGAQYPSIEIGGRVVKTGPVWFFLENDFEIRAGDTLRVTAAPSLRTADVYALSIVNTKTQAQIALRDAQGVPEWSGGRGRQRGERSGTACIDPAGARTYAGTVDKVTMGAGIEMPTLVVKVGAGLVAFRIGPERILLENDFELQAGEAVTVAAAWSPCSEANVAFSITNSSGETLVLRNEDGRPAW